MTGNNLEVDNREEVIKKRRKKLKISIGVIAVVLLVIATLYTFVRSHYEMPNEIDDLNNNIDLPFKFNTPMSEYDIDEEWIEFVESYAIWVKKNDEERYGFFSGLNDDYLTYKFAYYFTDISKTSLFGFRVGDSMEKVDKQLRKHGYKCESIWEDYVSYQRGWSIIWIYVSESIDNKSEYTKNRMVTRYSVNLDSTEEVVEY